MALCAVAVSAAAVWVPLSASRPEASPRRPHFVDVAPRSQISYVTNNDYTGRKYFQQPVAGGVAILDYDNDGKMDVYFTNGAKYPQLKKADASFYN